MSEDAHHDHDHGPGHHHHGVDASNPRRLAIVLGLAIAFSIFELTGGLITGSLALLADAFHLLSDVAALALSLFAAWIANRPAGSQRTFGYRRAEILAALVNGAGLAGMALVLMYTAVGRFGQSSDINGLGVAGFALGALCYEGISLTILARARDNLNVRGAFLHVASDALGSLGAIFAGLSIWAFGWMWADPVASIAIGLLVLRSAWALIRDAVEILMEKAPAHLDVEEIRAAVLELPDVTSLHDLHVWTIGSGEVSLSSHVKAAPEAEASGVLRSVRDLLRATFEISHTTIQVETTGTQAGASADDDCEGACA